MHLRSSTKDAPKGWLTDLIRLNSKARGSFKPRYLNGGDAAGNAVLRSGGVGSWIDCKGRVGCSGVKRESVDFYIKEEARL